MVDLAGIFKDTILISGDGDSIGGPAPFDGGFIGPGVAITERVKPQSRFKVERYVFLQKILVRPPKCTQLDWRIGASDKNLIFGGRSRVVNKPCPRGPQFINNSVSQT